MGLGDGPRRGELVTIAISGDYGKPRPALVIQADAFVALPSVTVLRLTSELHDWPLLRITVTPDAANGLRKPSQIMIDKATTVPRAKLGARIGRIDADTLRSVEQALQAFLGLDRTPTSPRASVAVSHAGRRTQHPAFAAFQRIEEQFWQPVSREFGTSPMPALKRHLDEKYPE